MNIVGKSSKINILSGTQVGPTRNSSGKKSRTKEHRHSADVETEQVSAIGATPESDTRLLEPTTPGHIQDSFYSASAVRRVQRRADVRCEIKENKTRPPCLGLKDPPIQCDGRETHSEVTSEYDVNDHHARGSDANNNSIRDTNSTAVRKSSGSSTDAGRFGRKKGKKGKKGATKNEPSKKSEKVKGSTETSKEKGSKAKGAKKKVEKTEVGGRMSKTVSLLKARSSSVGRKKKSSVRKLSRKYSKFEYKEAIRRIQKEVTHVFNVLDLEKAGKISLGSVRVGVRALNLCPTEREMNELEDLMFEFEEAQEGTLISMQSFVNVLTGVKLEHRYQPVSESELLMAFRSLDLKREGFIQADELREIMMHEGEPFTDIEMRWMLEDGMDDEGPHFEYKRYVPLMTRNIQNLPY